MTQWPRPHTITTPEAPAGRNCWFGLIAIPIPVSGWFLYPVHGLGCWLHWNSELKFWRWFFHRTWRLRPTYSVSHARSINYCLLACFHPHCWGSEITLCINNLDCCLSLANREHSTTVLFEQNSGWVFTVGEGQATIEIVDTQSDLRPSAMRMETSK